MILEDWEGYFGFMCGKEGMVMFGFGEFDVVDCVDFVFLWVVNIGIVGGDDSDLGCVVGFVIWYVWFEIGFGEVDCVVDLFVVVFVYGECWVGLDDVVVVCECGVLW